MLNWGFTLADIEQMVPFEREIYIHLIQKEITRKVEMASRR
jgi:hypothetical protein